MGQDQSEANKSICREAFDALFNKRDECCGGCHDGACRLTRL
jgi:hypothetical protein